MKPVLGPKSIIAVFAVLIVSTHGYSQSNFWQKIADVQAADAIIVKNNGDIFVGADHGMMRSTDDGASWERINSGFNNLLQVISLAFNSDGDLFAGTNGDGIYRSTDAGNSWQQINDDRFTRVPAIAIAWNGYVLAGTRHNHMDRGIFLSEDIGNSWKETNILEAGPNTTTRNISAIALDSDGCLFAINGGVFLSTDHGLSWTRIGYVPTGPNVLAVNSKNELFAGTNGGVYRSVDHGVNCGSKRVFAYSLTLAPDEKLLASGPGVFRSIKSTTSIKKTEYSLSLWKKIGFTAVQYNLYFVHVILVMGIISLVRLIGRHGKMVWDVLIPVASTVLYLSYESTIPARMNIRIDLLFLYPLLFGIVVLNCIQLALNLRSRRRKARMLRAS